ncbi:MAG: site-specific integrase [Gemmatimonadetes bacterium]|nr:site-specific integrase [Gemmatimonadota bacterium]
MLLRDPKAPGWTPGGEVGEPTQSELIARTWEAAYRAAWENKAVRASLGIVDADAHPLARPLGPAVDAYLLERGRQGLALNTLNGDQTALRRLLAWYGKDALISHVRGEPKPGEQRVGTTLGDHFRRMLDEGYALKTCVLWLTKMQQFLRAHGSTAADGVVLASREARHNRQAKTAWTDEEIAAVRKEADEVDLLERRPFSYRLAVELGLATGLRLGELFAARWENILYPRSRRIHVIEQANQREMRLTTLKGGRERFTVVLPTWWEWHQPDARGLILGGPDGAPLYGREVAFFVSRILEAAGIKRPGEAAHMLRHTYARLFLEGGGTLHQLKFSLGHASILTTEQNYEHYAVAAAVSAESIFYPDDRTLRSA